MAFSNLALWEGIFAISVTGTQIFALLNQLPKSISNLEFKLGLKTRGGI